MRIVVVTNTTMQPLVGLLKGHDVIVSGVSDLLTWLVDTAAPAAETATEMVVVCPDGDSLLSPLGSTELLDELGHRLEVFARSKPAVQVVATTLLAQHRSASSFADGGDPLGRLASRARWELRLAELSSNLSNVTVLDLRGLAEEHGRTALVNDAYWYLGRIRFSHLGFEVLAKELLRIVAALSSRARKVLVLDLDNTLWGGVLGEEGVVGIELGEEGIGKCFRDFQRQILALKEAGTILAVVSKNDSDIVAEALSSHPSMVLKPDDFVEIDTAWTNKSDRLAAMAERLDLGLDAFVFIDDNPAERDLVRSTLPSVAVPDFPSQPETLVGWFLEQVVPELFPRSAILSEDRGKTQQYQAQGMRRQAATADMDGFLASLDIRLTFRINDVALVPRLAQLTQKTNQFNLTTQRLTTAEIHALITSQNHAVVACDYADRFGDEGTVGLAIVDLDDGSLMNLLLSCRVLGRGVEDALLAEVERWLVTQGKTALSGQFVPTARNAVASSFLAQAGFRLTDKEGTLFGVKDIS